MGAQGKLDVPEAAPVGDLGPNHGEEMVPAGKMLHVTVPVVFLDKVTKILSIEELAKLIENIWNLGNHVAK